jgi:hypothetical protein
MRVSIQLHNLIKTPSRKECMIPIGLKAVWAPNTRLNTVTEKNSFLLLGIKPPTLQPADQCNNQLSHLHIKNKQNKLHGP